MSILEALNTAQRWIKYADYCPIVNWYTFIPRIPLAVSQVAHGAISGLTGAAAKTQFLDGALNAGRAFVAYKIVYQMQPDDLEKWVTASIVTSVMWAGFDISRGSTTFAELQKLGAPNMVTAADKFHHMLKPTEYVPLLSTVTGSFGRFPMGVLQVSGGFFYAAGACAAYLINAVLGSSAALGISRQVIRIGVGQFGQGWLNVGRAIVAVIPVLGNLALGTYDAGRAVAN